MIQSRQVQLLFVLLLALLLGTGFMHGKSLEKDLDLVEERNEIFMETYKKLDPAGMSELYTADAKLLPPNSESVVGSDNLVSYWQAIMDTGISEIKLHTGDVERYGKALVEVSIAELHGEDGELVDKSKYIVIWKQERGTWKMYLDMFNSNMPVE
ncbi:YybH family protein [Rhodohalobacter sp.]|uniref:YybH family protein n=1 Tax=Rhodohalobacter sp. TaxID=1974210 RepID=UPI0035614A64